MALHGMQETLTQYKYKTQHASGSLEKPLWQLQPKLPVYANTDTQRAR